MICLGWSGGDWLPDRRGTLLYALLYMRRGDRLADRRERRGIVEFNIFTNLLQSEVAP